MADDRGGMRRGLDDDADNDDAAAAPEAGPKRPLFLRLYEFNPTVWGVLALIAGVGGIGYTGGMFMRHSRRFEDFVAPAKYHELENYLFGFLVAAGLLVGLVVAGAFARKLSGWIAFCCLVVLLATTFAFTNAMDKQLELVRKRSAFVCEKAVIKSTRQAVTVCTEPQVKPKNTKRANRKAGRKSSGH